VTDVESDALEPSGDLAIPRNRDQVDAIERARVSDVAHHLASEVHASTTVRFQGSNDWLRYNELRDH
jgi:hypothetical protein